VELARIAALVVRPDRRAVERLHRPSLYGLRLQLVEPARLLLRSLRTLEIRVRRQVESAAVIAERLAGHPKVQIVRYPGLGSLISFDLADADAVRRVETSTRLVVNATSLGSVTSLLEGRFRWEGDRIPSGLLRLSVGLEDPEEIWADLAQALGNA